MLIYIIHPSKYYTFRLPKIPSGSYVIEDFDENGIVKNLVNVVEKDSKWIMSSNENVRIIHNDQLIASCELALYKWYTLSTSDGESILLYTAALYDNNYYIESVSDACSFIIGNGSDCDIFLPLSFLSEKQLELSYDGVNWNIKNLNPNIGMYINTVCVSEKKLDSFDFVFMAGFIFRVCGNIIFINNTLKIIIKSNLLHTNKLSLAAKDYSSLFQNYTDYYNSTDYFFKSPVFFKKINCLDITLESPEQKVKEQYDSLIMSMIPTVIMSFSTLITTFFTLSRGKIDKETLIITVVMLGSMAFLSFVWPFIERFVQRVRSFLRERARISYYKKYLAYKRNFLEKYRNEQKIALFFNNLSMDECQNVIFNRTANLFSLNVTQEQFLAVRIGVGKKLLSCNLIYDKIDFVKEEDPLRKKLDNLIEDFKYINDSPITVSFKESIAFINPERDFDKLLETLIVQLAAYHDYHILKLVIFTDDYSKLHYIRNLNHCWNDDKSLRYVATNLQEAEFISNELMKAFNARKENPNYGEETPLPFYLILTDDINKYRNLKIIDSVVHQKENIGFSFAAFVSRLTDVPDGCHYFCDFSKERATVFKNDMSESEIISFTPEFYTSKINFTRCISELCNIPVKSNAEASSGKLLPEKLGFLEMFNVGNVEQLNSAERWKKSQIVNTLATPIGVDTTGNILNLDLHEKKHGPHGLVAGMTGSGKSETIVTYLLSLAVNYSPDEVQFVLIDYKGGGLAGAFENRKTGIKLPHLVGTITNLDTAEMNRTLVSIKSELKRRQMIFNKAKENLNTGTIDIYKYQGLVRDGLIKEPLSHLFIVCDEFAELKQQQPDFMDEIVSAARIGRSLGIHLILATQKPSGVVDEQVWSNSKFKICCKVQTAEDSSEMLRKPDAAYIKESGRFYLQIGYDEYYILAQSGYSGVEYVPTDRALSKLDGNISFINSLGEVYKNATYKGIENAQEKKTNYGEELINVVKYLIDVAKKEKYQYHQLWLDNVPEVLLYNSVVNKYQSQVSPFDINPVIGEYDDPARQNQGLVTLPITTGGNTFIVGNSGSGKCTLLSTIISSTIITHNSDEVNIYIIDMGAEKLKKFSKAPQVGDVLTIQDAKELNFLAHMLHREMFLRQKYFSENGGDFLYCVKNKKCPFPNIMVIIYDLDTFKESFDYFFEENFVPMSRNCSKYGINFIVTSNSPNTLGYSAEQTFTQKLMLNMTDTSDYSVFFNHPPIIKKNAGRGLIEINGECFEFQTALFFQEQNEIELLKKIIDQLNTHLKTRAKPVPRIPEVVTFDSVKDSISTLGNVPMGINTSTAQIAYNNFDKLVTIISSERIQTFSKFSMIFQKLLLGCENTKLIILNGFPEVNINPYESAKVYNSGFVKVLNIIKNNIEKYKETPQDGKFVIMVLNYSILNLSLKSKKKAASKKSNQELGINDKNDTQVSEESNEEVYTISDLINLAKDINNFRFILYDLAEMAEGLKSGEIVDYFDGTSGIWLGRGYDSQMIYDLPSSSFSPTITNDDGLVLLNNEHAVEAKIIKE